MELDNLSDNSFFDATLQVFINLSTNRQFVDTSLTKELRWHRRNKL